MRIGLDYRTVGSSPHSGISRQVYAMEQALESLPGTQVTRFTVAPLDDPLRQRAVCPPWGCPRTAMHQPHQRLRFEAGFLPRALREQDIDLYISTFNMGLPLPPRPPGVRYALLIHDLFQITLKNYHANRLKALVYRVSDYLSIAYALRVADRVWTPSQYSADEAVRLFPGVAGKVRVLPNQADGFAGEPADLSARGLPPRYWLLVGTRELRKNVPGSSAPGPGRAPRRPACRRWCWSAASTTCPRNNAACPACTRSAGSTTPNCTRCTARPSGSGNRPTRKASACRWSRR